MILSHHRQSVLNCFAAFFSAQLLAPSSAGDDAESWTILDQDPDEIETGSEIHEPAPISVLRGASRVQQVDQEDHGELVLTPNKR